VISQVCRGDVACGESDTWHGVPLTVPPLPPTSKLDDFCKLMEIAYHLNVSISAVLMMKNENQTHLILVSLVTLPDKCFTFYIVSLSFCLVPIYSTLSILRISVTSQSICYICNDKFPSQSFKLVYYIVHPNRNAI